MMNEDCNEICRSLGGWPDLQGKCSCREPFGVARILTLDKSFLRRYRKLRSMPSKSPWKFDFLLVTFWIFVIFGASQASVEPIPVTSLRPTPDLSIANISVNSSEELGQYRKNCTAAFVDSIESAKKLNGCVVIKGSLDIQIRSKMNVTNELEENLSAIEIITGYLKISKSFPLMSLRFLRKLRVIKGKTLESSKYALVVRENENLAELWNWSARKPDGELRIERGQIFFHFNPKLCVNTIKQLQVKLGDRFEHVDDLDVGQKSNGHKVACNNSDVVGNKPSDPNSLLAITDMYWIAIVLAEVVVLCVIVLAVVCIITLLLFVYCNCRKSLDCQQPCSMALDTYSAAPDPYPPELDSCSPAHNQSSTAHSSGSTHGKN